MVTRWIGLDICPSNRKIYLQGNDMFPYFYLTREAARRNRIYSSIEPVKVRVPESLANIMKGY